MSKFKSKKVVYLSVATFLLILIVGAVLIKASPEVASSYYYFDEKIDLALDTRQIMITYKNNSSPHDRSATSEIAGLAIEWTEITGIKSGYRHGLVSKLADKYQANEKIESIIASEEVEFVSPIFHGVYFGWLAVTPDILVGFKEEYISQSEKILQELAPGLNIVSRDQTLMPGFYKLHSNSRNGFDVLALANQLAEDSRIAWAEPDMHFTGQSSLTPNDPGFTLCWGIKNTGQFGGAVDADMDGDDAWDITTGSADIKVLIIDVGVDQSHADIYQLTGADFTGEGGGGGPVNSCDNHGTPVAGAVSAVIDNSLGTVGIAPTCPTVSARCFIATVGSPCSGGWSANYSWTADALSWGSAQGHKISNNSNYYGSPSSTVAVTYTSTYIGGMVHFSSAGNSNSSIVSFPAVLYNVNAIAALNDQGNKASFSNYGADISLSAPGEHIYLPDRTGSAGYEFGDYGYRNGTSFASPYTAGVAALMLSQYPTLTPEVLEHRLRCSAVDYGAPGWDIYYGDGFVNAYNALTYADTDGDGIFDQCDNCPNDFNTFQEDSDGDGLGDYCDNCPDVANLSQENSDSDSFGDECDNCPYDYNPMQLDDDSDGIGNVCDWICGEVDGIAGINILDIVFLINYKYKDGPAPDPEDAGDVDGIAPVNILDIVYLIAEIYKEGPELNCP